VKIAIDLGILIMAIFAAYWLERLPANLIQVQRNYFDAHAYCRVDKDGAFHTK